MASLAAATNTVGKSSSQNAAGGLDTAFVELYGRDVDRVNSLGALRGPEKTGSVTTGAFRASRWAMSRCQVNIHGVSAISQIGALWCIGNRNYGLFGLRP